MSRKTLISGHISTSWKVLLPVDSRIQILAMGLSVEEIVDLREYYTNTHTELSQQRYNVIVIRGKNVDEQRVNKGLRSLADDGMLIIIGNARVRRRVKNKHLFCISEYAGLPADQPRLLIPLKSISTRNLGISFHNPGSNRSKAWLRVVKILNSIGISLHLRRHIVSIWSISGFNQQNNSIKQWISTHAGLNVDEIVIYGGAGSGNRKITILAFSADRRKKVVAKIADTPDEVSAIKRESTALQVLSKSKLAQNVPSLIDDGVYGPYYIQLQSCLPKVPQQYGKLSPAHISFLAELSRINKRKIPVYKTKEWRLIQNVKSAQTRILPESLRRIISGVQYVDKGKLVDCHMVHGDFAPWNIIHGNGNIFVYDWEFCQETGLPFHDIFHFIYNQASLVGPWRGPRYVVKSMINASKELAWQANLKFNVHFSLALWCINRYFSKPESKLIALATEFEKRKFE